METIICLDKLGFRVAIEFFLGFSSVSCLRLSMSYDVPTCPVI